jgi:hypothetical protein
MTSGEDVRPRHVVCNIHSDPADSNVKERTGGSQIGGK